MSASTLNTEARAEIIIYQPPEGGPRLELRLSLRTVEHALHEDPVTADEAAALLGLVTNYALVLLDDYDDQRVTPTPTFAETTSMC